MRTIDLAWIRIFVQVGRLGSLSEAAKALGLTQPAVSYQIRRAEQEFGVPLLRRLHRGVELTETGGLLYDILSGSVQRVDDLAARIRSRQTGASLKLYTDYAFSAFWLIPRIHKFSLANPGIDIQIVASQQTDPRLLQSGDVAILFGSRDQFGGAASLLMPERVMPVCAPGLAGNHTKGEFEGLRLIHLDSSGPPVWLDWRRYLASIGTSTLLASDSGSLRMNTYSLVVEAAISGQGVALGWRGLIDGHLDRGTLVPFGAEVSPPDRGYFLVNSDSRAAAAEKLQDWLLSEVP
jgi:putative choline sulfate-utilization transcription factor